MSGSDLSTLESCLLVSDAPESVWRPALHSLRMELEQARLDNISAFDLLSRVRMALGDNGKRMQDELIEYCKRLVSLSTTNELLKQEVISISAQLSQAREALEEIERAEFYSPEGAAELVWELHRIARAALAAMKGK